MSWRRRWLATVTVVTVVAGLSGGCASTSWRPAVLPESAPRAQWTRLPDGPLSPRHDVTGAWVGGRFVLVGGWDSKPCGPNASCAPPERPALRDGAAYDPTTGRWSAVRSAPVPVSAVTAPVVVGDTMYLLTGDQTRDDSPVAMLAYSVKNGTWKRLAAPAQEGLTLVATGTKIAAITYAGERQPAKDYLFDTRSQAWRSLPRDPLGRSYNRAGLWWQGRLLLLASALDLTSEEPPTYLAALDIDSLTWKRLPDITIGGGNAVVVAGRVVHAFSSYDGVTFGHGEFYPNGAVIDPEGGTWRLLPRPPRGKGLVGYVLPVGNRTMVGGHLVDPVTQGWTALAKTPWPTADSRSVLTSTSTILAWGGTSGDRNVAEGWLLSP